MGSKRHTLTWDQVLHKHVIPYKEEHGDLLVHVDYRTEDGYDLPQWISVQRRKKRQGTLLPEREKALEDLGMVWSVRRPDMWLEDAEAYFQEHGHLRVPAKYTTPDGTPLGTRLDNTRRSYRLGTLRQETVDFLYSLDPDWAGTGPDREGCRVPECADPQRTKGLCAHHYNQLRLHGSPVRVEVLVYCQVSTCGRFARREDWCADHWVFRVDGHGRTSYRTRAMECGGRCEVCRADHILERAEARRQEIDTHILPRAKRLDLVGALWSGTHLEEACAGVGLTANRLWTLARSVPGLAEVVDEALAATRNPYLTHASEYTYRKYRCRCPQCRAAKLAGTRGTDR